MDKCYLGMFKWWTDKKEKFKHNARNFYYWNDILNKMIVAFKWNNLPESIPAEFLESYLQLNGTVGITKKGDKIICFTGGYADDIDEYGLGTNYIGTTHNGDSFNGKIGEDIIVGINNSTRSGRGTLIDMYAGMLSDITESMEIGIINSRIVPIPTVKNDTQKAQVEEAITKIKEGSHKVIVADDLFEDDEQLGTINLTDPSAIEKLQYYSRFYEDTLKRLWLESGIEINSKDKAAQVNTSELNEFKEYSRIMIEDMLHRREELADAINEKWGLDVTVELNKNFDNVVEEVPEDDNVDVDEQEGDDNNDIQD